MLTLPMLSKLNSDAAKAAEITNGLAPPQSCRMASTGRQISRTPAKCSIRAQSLPSTISRSVRCVVNRSSSVRRSFPPRWLRRGRRESG